MDKEEYHQKLDELTAYVREKDYENALSIVDSIDWRRVKSINTLNMVADVYEVNKDYESAKDILVLAYSRASIGRNILYRLVEVCIRLHQIDEAEKYFREFSKVAKNDNSRCLLQYKLFKAKGAPLEAQIDVLEEYKEREYTERWAYELAVLYSKAGDTKKCVETCDDLILWFSEGRYVMKAMELKKQYAALTPSQEQNYNRMKAAANRRKQEQSAGAPSEDTESTEEDASARAGIFKEEEREVPESSSFMKRDRNRAEAVGSMESDNQSSGRGTGSEQEHPAESAAVEFKDRLEKGFHHVIHSFTEESVDSGRNRDQNATVDSGRNPGRYAGSDLRGTSDAGRTADTERYSDEDLRSDFRRSTDESQASSVGGSARPSNNPELKQQNSVSERKMTPAAAAAEKARREGTSRKMNTGDFNLDAFLAETAGSFSSEIAAGAAKKETAGTAKADAPAEERGASKAEAAAKTADTVKAETPVEETGASKAEAAAEKADTVKAEAPVEEAEAVEIETPEAEAEIVEEKVSDGTGVKTGTRFEEAEVVEEESPEEAEVVEEESPEEAETVEEETEKSKDLAGGIRLRDLEEEDLSREVTPETLKAGAGTETEGTAAGAGSVPSKEVRTDEASADTDSAKPKKKEIHYIEELEIPDPQPSEEERASHTHTIPLDTIGANTVPISIDKILSEETPEERRIRIMNRAKPTRMNEEQRKIFTYFARIPGMDAQILEAISCVYEHAGEKTSLHGNIAVMGARGTGKTRLTHGLVVAMCKDLGMDAAKVARVKGADLNEKDPAKVVARMAGGFFVIEDVSGMNEATVEKLSQAMEFRTDCMITIIEDEKVAMRAFLKKYPRFAAKFDRVISIPVFTNDELITFARTYATENGYKIDDMAILALYTMIGNMQTEEEPVTISIVKDMIDKAISRSSAKRRRSRKNKKDKWLVLQEKDFNLT
ncbi:hypothetical protein [Bilifractor sp. HCP3S3_D3]|uniref:tetratricopeptide repeat protein n=1 Tax=Bilifractor sp. HCP3S3_D3 TaxID=3438907 RepID=UPI003F8C86F7